MNGKTWQALQFVVDKAIDVAPQAGNFVKTQVIGNTANLMDKALGADGLLKGLFNGVDYSKLNEFNLAERIKIQRNLEKLESYLEERTGEELELNTPIDAVSSVIKLLLEKPKNWTEAEWNFDNLINTGDTVTKYFSETWLNKQISPKDFILDKVEPLKENSINLINGTLESANAELQEVEVSNLVEIVETDSIVGGISSSLTYILYEVTKEFLSLEGARRRNEISNGEVLKCVLKTALSSSTKGIVIGLVFSIAILIIGEWLFIPLAIIAPFALVKMPMNLWNAFWEGLNEEQRQELLNSANQLGGNTASFFNSLGT